MYVSLGSNGTVLMGSRCENLNPRDKLTPIKESGIATVCLQLKTCNYLLVFLVGIAHSFHFACVCATTNTKRPRSVTGQDSHPTCIPACILVRSSSFWLDIHWLMLPLHSTGSRSVPAHFLSYQACFFGKLDWRSCSADEELWHAKPVNGLPHSDICIISVQTILTRYLIYDEVYGRWVNMRSCQCMNDRIGPKKVENEKTVELRSFIAASSNIGSIDFF